MSLRFWLALPLPASAGGDPLRLQLFSGLDRQAVAVGETVWLELEARAVPRSNADRAALIATFSQIDVAAQVGDGFEVVETRPTTIHITGAVVELRRGVGLRVRSGDVVPGIRLSVPARGRIWTYQTRGLKVQPFAWGPRVQVASRSVVSLTARGAVDGVRFERIGSAFLVGDDALVTAYHVVAGAWNARVRLPDGQEIDASHVWTLDPLRDVAVLHVDSETVRRSGLRPLVVAPDETSGGVGFTAGWPDRRQATTVARRYDDLVLVDQRLRAAGNAALPGDSGGPLLDEAGRVLGAVVSGRSTHGLVDLLPEGICLASDLRPALGQYRVASEPVALRRALRAAARAPVSSGPRGRWRHRCPLADGPPAARRLAS